MLLMVLLTAAPGAAQLRSVSILGDSYSTFEGFLQPDTNAVWYWRWRPDVKRTDVNDVRQTWWWQLVERNGLKLERNNSFSGATISYRGYRKEDYTNRSFVNRALALGSPDIILVFGATNDCWARVPLGEYMWNADSIFRLHLAVAADSTKALTESPLWTFRPALVCLIDELRLHYPTAELWLLVNNILTDEYKESIHAVCDRLGVQTIDLQDIEMKAGHPTQQGQRDICRQVEAVLFSRCERE